ncbi:MAG: hypothetical protein E5V78_35630, partial [Mesorhizobium sp.]
PSRAARGRAGSRRSIAPSPPAVPALPAPRLCRGRQPGAGSARRRRCLPRTCRSSLRRRRRQASKRAPPLQARSRPTATGAD